MMESPTQEEGTTGTLGDHGVLGANWKRRYPLMMFDYHDGWVRWSQDDQECRKSSWEGRQGEAVEKSIRQAMESVGDEIKNGRQEKKAEAPQLLEESL